MTAWLATPVGAVLCTAVHPITGYPCSRDVHDVNVDPNHWSGDGDDWTTTTTSEDV